MQKSVVIDYLPESVSRYRHGWAVVAIDVIRATTTAVTAAAAGWRCFPTPSIESALTLAERFDHPLLAGECGGDIPAGFEMDNSPAQLANRSDRDRPLVLVSSSGTKVIHEAAGCEAVYLSCFRNYLFLADYLAGRHAQVAIIGAGSLGEFREEDQACCSWIAGRLMQLGYSPKNSQTSELVSRWRQKSPEACLCSRSVTFLKRTNRLGDLDFIFQHINDVPAAFAVQCGEVQVVRAEDLSAPRRESAGQEEQVASALAEY